MNGKDLKKYLIISGAIAGLAVGTQLQASQSARDVALGELRSDASISSDAGDFGKFAAGDDKKKDKDACAGKDGCGDKDAGKHACKGMNSCKGKGACKGGDNGCAGKNSCKGKGGCNVPVKHAKG